MHVAALDKEMKAAFSEPDGHALPGNPCTSRKAHIMPQTDCDEKWKPVSNALLRRFAKRKAYLSFLP